METLKGYSLAGQATNYERVKNDYYATPSESTKALLNAETFKGNILEPCCGQGHISKILEDNNYSVHSNDLVNRGYGNSFKDFLKSDFKTYDNIITNPPFKYAQQFIEKSLKISNNKVAMFAKLQLLEGVNRYKLFQTTPLKHVYVFSNRQNPLRNGMDYNPATGKEWASTMCFAWFVWEHGYQGKPMISWLKTK